MSLSKTQLKAAYPLFEDENTYVTRALDLLPPTPANVEEVEDINCLSNDELEILEVLYNKIAAHNPGICGPCHRDRTAIEKEHAARLIQDGLDQARNSQN